MSSIHFALAALLALAATPAFAAPPPTIAMMESGGSIAQAAAAFQPICLAHPGDVQAQRSAALAASPRRFVPEPASPPGIESLTAWPVQLSLLATDEGRICAILSPLVDTPTPAAAVAEVRRRLHLGTGTLENGEHVWHRTQAGQRQIIAFAIATQPDSDGVARPTVQLTLSATKAR